MINGDILVARGMGQRRSIMGLFFGLVVVPAVLAGALTWVLQGCPQLFAFSPRRDSATEEHELLPNGHSRSEYHNKYFTDQDIVFLGLDQPGAPPPHIAGLEIMDAMDGDYDGEIDF